MNEAQQILTEKLNQLDKLLGQYPDLTHVYMRRDNDDVLVDVSRDAARATITRHPNWTIESVQHTEGMKKVKNPVKNPFNGPGGTEEAPTDEQIKEAAQKLEEADPEVPAKPSEEKPAKQPKPPKAPKQAK